ncbi:MAG: Stp1/IreP family PP2C-type Ser/Thr phosphatase [Ilumatobacteraceae bacterium]
MAELRWGATTDAGRVRTENEDTFVAEPMVFAVADGMGGHQAGEVASALAASIIRDRLGAGAASEDAAAAAVGEANEAIYGAAKANPALSGMGTTLTAIAVLTEDDPAGDDRLVLLNVGDSRTYRFRNGRLQRVTVDHSYVQELVAAGHISIEEARTHPRRNIVTRALGIEPMVRADVWTLPLVRGDRYVLASDGLVDEVPDHEILDLVMSIADPQELSKQLVDIANRHGGHDNVTVVVVDVIEGADPPDPTDELQMDPAWAEGIPEPALWADDVELPDPAEPEPAEDPTAGDPGADGGAGSHDLEPITERDLTAMPTEPPAGMSMEAAPTPSLPPTPPPPPPSDDDLAPIQVPEVESPSTTPASISAPIPVSTSVSPPVPTLAAAAPPSGGMRIADSAMITEAATGDGGKPGKATKGAKGAKGAKDAKDAKDAKGAKGTKVKRERFTFGVFLFVVLVAAIVATTFTLIAVHARSGYFVAFDGDTVVVYKGQRDGVLWFEPTVNARSDKFRDELSPEIIALVEARTTFESPNDAADFIETKVPTTTIPETTTTSSTPATVPATSPIESTTTTVPTGG